MSLVTVGLYFFCILFGIFAGLYAGLCIRSYFISRREKKDYKRNYVKKQNPVRSFKVKKKRNKPLKNSKDPSGVLNERIPETESYTNFLCSSVGEDASELIKKMRKSQDSKYVNRIQK